MQRNKRNISNDIVSKEVIKAFVLLQKRNKKYPKIADIIYYLNLDKILKNIPHKDLKGKYYSFTGFVNLFLFMKLNNTTNQSWAERYLRKHKPERKKLGLLKGTPDQTRISNFKIYYMTDEIEEILDLISNQVKRIANEIGLDLNFYQKKKKTKVNEEQLSKSPIIRKNCIKIFKKIKPFIPIHLRCNAAFNVKDYLELFLEMSRCNDFAENASVTLREDRKEKRVFCPNCYQLLEPLSIYSNLKKDENYWICKHCGYIKRISPNADTHFYHIKKLDINQIQREYDIVSEKIWNEGLRAQNINQSARLELSYLHALDTTTVKTYPNLRKKHKNNTYIKGGKAKNDDYWGYEYITLDIVEHGKRFVIKALPVYPGEDVKKKAIELLEYARQLRIFPKILLADRGFYINNFRKMLEKIRVRYIIPVKRDREMLNKLNKTPTPSCYKDYKHGNQDTLFNLIIVKGKGFWKHHEDIKYAFATNIDINDEKDIEKIADTYPKRWGVETAYRIKKEDYLPKTTSKNPKVRLYYFLYSVMMYNLWFLADILTWLEIRNKVGNGRILKSKLFRCKFKNIMTDPG